MKTIWPNRRSSGYPVRHHRRRQHPELLEGKVAAGPRQLDAAQVAARRQRSGQIPAPRARTRRRARCTCRRDADLRERRFERSDVAHLRASPGGGEELAVLEVSPHECRRSGVRRRVEQRQSEHVVNRLHKLDVQQLLDLFGQSIKVVLVPCGNEHGRDSSARGSRQLLLQTADGSTLPRRVSSPVMATSCVPACGTTATRAPRRW